MKKFYQDESWLWKSYVDEKMSLREIADEAGCSYQTIYRYLKLFGIPVRTQLESISKDEQPEKAVKKTQTVQEAFQTVAKLEKLVAEVEELEELIKALKGEPSSYHVSESEAEHNRQVAHGKARKERYRQMEEDLKYEKQKRGGATHCGDVRDELYEILELTGDKI